MGIKSEQKLISLSQFGVRIVSYNTIQLVYSMFSV